MRNVSPAATREVEVPADYIDTPISISMTPAEAHDFITRLAGDDRFRSEIERDPANALARHGIHVPLEHIPAGATLPSKDALAKALANFKQSGEIDLAAMSEPSGWPFMLFWWLYMTPAKPQRGQEGGTINVRAR